MSHADHGHVKELFLAACERPPEARSAFLAEACGEDDELRREVVSLLGFHRESPEVSCSTTASAPAAGPVPETEAWTPSLESGRTISHYSILRPLGAGGAGEVYEGEDLRLGRRVALKFLQPWVARDEALRARFQREARAASALDHPNICTIHEIDETEDGRLFIVMAYYRGETLDKKIDRGPLAMDDAFDIAIQVARGLARAHELGIVHRDVKPANILLTEDSTAKILDFGLAKRAGRADLTLPGWIMGTASYMSPEQARGEKVDPRTDIWSLGVVLYEMVTGTRPFRGERSPGGGQTEPWQAVVFSILSESPVPVASVRPSASGVLERVIGRALAKRPADRYPRMADMLRDLSSFEKSLSDMTPPSELPCPFPDRDEEPAAAGQVFVAREGELAQLHEFLDSALAGRGRVAFIRGEAGTGKTALMAHFARCAQETHGDVVAAGGNCNAHTSIGDPYLPFCEVLALLTSDIEAGWAARAMTREQASRLWRLLPRSLEVLLADGPGLIDTFVPGAALLGRARARTVVRDDCVEKLARLVESRAAGGDAGAQNQRDLFEQVTRVLHRLSRQVPLLILLDNLQWADAGSISLLFHLGRRLEGSRLLILGAFRPTEVALGRGQDRHPLEPVLSEFQRDFGSLELDLDRTPGREFVEAFLDGEPNRLGAAFRETLLRQTRGHALHTVELVREMEERAALVRDREGRWVEGPALDWTSVPARVEAVISERVARVPESLRELLTLASVEGEDFTAEVVARALGADEMETVHRLSRELDQRHRLVEPRGTRRTAAGRRLSLFRFRHHLFQKYLYSSLAEPEQAYLHERVGSVLEALYAEQAPEISTRLARHFEQAGLGMKAAHYLLQAGEKAFRQSAHHEAITHFNKGLTLLRTLPEDAERNREELALLTGLGPILMGVKGWAAPETEETYARARELCQQVPETPQLFPVLWGLWQGTILRADLEAAREMAEELLRLAELSGESALLPVAYRALAETSFWRCELAAASDFAQQGLAHYDPQEHRSHGFVYGTDPGVFCLGFFGWSLWYLGYPDQAMEKIQRMVSLAREIDHKFSLGMALDFVAIGRHARGELGAALEAADATSALAREQGFEFLTVIGSLMHGGTLAELGDAAAGVAEMRQALERFPQPLAQPWWRAMLAAGLVRAGEHRAALETIAEGLAASDRTGNRVWDSDLHRLRGEALANQGAPTTEVESCFRRALGVARRQGARSLELRGATSLARLLQDQGRKREARRILTEVHSGFTEGFATRDLREAGELLEFLV